MKFTRLKTTVVAGVMAASMILPGMTAFASAEEDAKISAGTLSVTKTIKVGEGVTVPATTLKFTADQVDGDNADGTTQPATIADTDVVIELAATTTTNGNGITATGTFANLETAITKNGEYTFTLSETAPTTLRGADDTEGWSVLDNNTYYLHVYKTDKGFTYIVTEGNKVNKDKEGNIVSLKDKVGSDEFAFVNEYTKDAGSDPKVDPEDPDDEDGKHGALEIVKTVTGDSAAYTDAFTFKVTLTNSSTSKIAEGDTLAYTLDGKDANATVKKAEDGSLYVEVAIANGQKASFKKIEAGVGVKVEETNRPNTDKTTVKAMFNGSDYSEAQEATSISGVLGQSANIVRFTNVATDITVTGVVTNVAPYITLVVVAVAAVAAYVVMKRRVAR